MNRFWHRGGGQCGLSLIEVLVALAIVAALAALAVPLARPGTGGLVLEKEARRVAANLREARGSAIRNNRPVDFAMDVASGVFGHERLERLAPGDPPIAASMYTTADQRRSAREGTIRFFADGGSTGGGVVLRQEARTVRVAVDWLTGRVSIARAAAEGSR